MNIIPATSVRQTIETTAAKPLYLTTHSPDLDPIEPTFANIKAPLRKTADESSMATGNGFSISSRQTNVETTSLRRGMDQPDLTSL